MLQLKFNQEGLIPVIAQDYRTGEIRMFAWANEEAIRKTIETGYAHYYSRSRKAIWKKGESSGELQRVVEIRVDCDEDVLLYIVLQEKNRACHTGERNCFFRDLEGKKVKRVLPFETLQRLQEIIQQRLEEMPENSYTVKLFKEGEDRILQKFGEEAIETLIALKRGMPEEIRAEASDMFYHLLLMLTVRNIGIEEVLEELASRIK
ncbi:MAG: bifunctional phosphoribosyl-AMP cyclohydrolase/phosphoribosyl-ATP diphosphatase HisIE [Aquificota bacterium]|jgi:phosphoribosyl-ATP pyrophosphohydrolase/phosphoribosyl-AMP cyclohydrolase|nr:bifunctional phosphoribosyl-AMP cyclohydrolase/phosphoribosyl-ATP diphosphatase HisIE [Aquificaceae bacterium]MDM7266615.1 bifunctional phosphoribosyl-AMP cyclohydrolase/phosphoribosyl-ATP diphosphatase HisIE [Aquificaceae bacterium]QWK12367.1 MAG: bifunctional phosphoribosyl-AMP cyclohydrolase/phosphoribosyl-ATP diphosphatase HisIE [Aquificota bacterium]HAV40646.1 bifunctional phosphoribosyl-AMP cyclohydrolase/phosphoribosyl-ATP pyrophosphatase [Aquificaceae bacterium]HCO38423.1 bifunctiona